MTDTDRLATLRDIDQLVPLFDGYRQFYGAGSDLSLARQFLDDRAGIWFQEPVSYVMEWALGF